MPETASNPQHRALFLLLAATTISFLVSHESAMGALAGVVTLGIACFKARLVVLDFMELRHAPRLWRLGFEGGLLSVTLVLMAIDLSGATGR